MYGLKKGIFAKGFTSLSTWSARPAASALDLCSNWGPGEEAMFVLIEPTVTIEGDIAFNFPRKT